MVDGFRKMDETLCPEHFRSLDIMFVCAPKRMYALPPSRSVNRSFALLNSAARFSSRDRNVRFGILFQNRPVSSTLKTNSGGYFSCSIITFKVPGN